MQHTKMYLCEFFFFFNNINADWNYKHIIYIRTHDSNMYIYEINK
jgi:hypothetical protein